MRWRTRFSKRLGRSEDWSRWFAWFPVIIGAGAEETRVWLAFVERRWTHSGGGWYDEHRIIAKEPSDA